MSDVPAWLTEAVVSAPGDSDPALREESPVDVLPGDICTVAPFGRSEGPRRLFLVVEAGDGWCEGMIASVETELATEVDVLLPAAETGLGYPIAIHRDTSDPSGRLRFSAELVRSRLTPSRRSNAWPGTTRRRWPSVSGCHCSRKTSTRGIPRFDRCRQNSMP